MAKEAYYFSHDCNAQDDPKIMHMMGAFKFEGYGIYWALIEKLRQDENYILPLSTLPFLATRWRFPLEKLKRLIFDFQLFSSDENSFWSESLIRRMKLRSEKGKKGAEARWNSSEKMQTHFQALPKNANAFPSNALKERKGKEIKGKEKKVKEMVGVKTPAILFRDSVFFDLEKFKHEFLNTKYAIYNLEFYYEKILNWSDSKEAKKIDWIATARNFMLGDTTDGKSVLQTQNITKNVTGNTKSGKADYSDLKAEIARDLGISTH